MTRKLFISYRRADSRWPTLALRQGLTPLLDIEIFMDIEAIRLAADFREAINQSVDDCDALIAAIGPNWLTARDRHGRRRIDDPNDWVRLEILRALENGTPVIPLLFDGADMPGEDALPDPLKPLAFRQGYAFSFDAYSAHIQDFVTRLTTLGYERREPDDPPPPPPPDEADEEGEDGAPDLHAKFFSGLETFHEGDYRAAERELAEVASRSMLANGHEDILTLRAQRGLSIAVSFQGRTVEAASILSIIAPILKDAHGEEHVDYLATRYELARALLNQGEAAEAEAALRDLLPVQEKVIGAEHPDTLTTRSMLARALLDQGEAEAAEAALRDLLPVQEKVSGAEHPYTLTTRFMLARALLDQGEATTAEAALRDLLPVREKISGAEHPETLVTRYRLAQAVLEGGRAAEARAALDELAPVAARVLAATDPRLGYIAFLRARAAEALGDRAAADGFVAEAEANWGDRLTPDHPYRREMAAFLAERGD